MESPSKESTLLSQGAMEAVMPEIDDLDSELEQLLGVNDCLHQDAEFGEQSTQGMPNSMVSENLPDSSEQITQRPVISCVSTCALPSMENYPGPYSFDVHLDKLAGDKAKWQHSKKLDKLFIVMNDKIPLRFKAKAVEPGLLVRILPIFLTRDSFIEPVQRCPTHASKLEKSNKDFMHVDHIIRCYHPGAMYQIDSSSRRLSVIVPAEPPQPGSDWFTIMCSFMCKNSCNLGMNHRSTALIFTLERETGEVVGRKLLNIRICSCPRRDMTKEEMDQNVQNTYSEREIMKMKCSDRKKLIKKPVKQFSNELVNVQIPKKYLKPLREMIYIKPEQDLTKEEKICLEDINKYLHYPLFGPSKVTPTIAMGVIDPCTQAAFQTENGSSAVEHAATASAAVAYASLVKDVCEVSPQDFMDVSHDPGTSGQVQEAILGDESVPSVCDPLPEMASEACILDPTSLTLSGHELMFTLRSQNSER